ncbi:transcriptional regulator [Bacillus cereus]|nr:transcriptional regulator [Bacillus cereus]
MSKVSLELREAVFMYIYREDYNISLQDIKEKTGIQEDELMKELLRLKIVLPVEQHKKYPQESLDLAVSLYKEKETNGLKAIDIVKMTGLHRSALYRELDKRGIETIRDFSTEKIEEAIQLFLNRKENGYRLKDIERETGISKTTLYRVIDNRGIEFENGNLKSSLEDKKKAVSLYLNREQNQMTVRQITKETGVSRTALYGELKKQGYKPDRM